MGRGARRVPWQPLLSPHDPGGPPGLQPVQSRPDSAPLFHWPLPTGPCCSHVAAPSFLTAASPTWLLEKGAHQGLSALPYTQQTFHKPVLTDPGLGWKMSWCQHLLLVTRSHGGNVPLRRPFEEFL
ncbi:hypothetical protein mRhiFer1_009274 [Rhinolophus ferrumequinum]|uniref:Uncharacterized protein n=1 Tax=Rhinolophus ferrumequinum TaxID=59479 RepID=A0A7J7RXH9_RHIFE|nr:hypothetical protein mRhiFer1_009274 [Rhinolophus ferrumequinum]